MVTSVANGGTQKLPMSEPTNMTIHWKALEEHFLMVPSVSRFKHFFGGKCFYEFLIKKSWVFLGRYFDLAS
jgi:hypothetical protein